MFNVDDFLSKFKKIEPPDNTIRCYVVDVIFDVLSIKIKKQDIKIKNNIVYIKTNNIVKNEIFLNKQTILDKINNKLNKNKINNIL